MLINNWESGLIISVSILVVQVYKSYRNNKFFITYFEIREQFLILKFKVENQTEEISDKKDEFTLKKKVAFSRSKVPYLLIRYKGKTLIRQFEIGEWDGRKIDEIILKFKEY